MPEDVIHLLANELANDLVRSIEGMTGEAPALALGTEGSGPRDGWTTWRQRFNASHGCAWLCADAAVWIEIGARTLAAAGIEDSDAEAAKGTFAEILGQAFAMLARSLSGRSGEEWNCTDGAESTGTPTSGDWSAVELKFADGYAAVLLLAFEDALLRAVESPRPSGAVAMIPAQPPAPDSPSASPRSKTLELLLDVELPVSVSFGRAQLPLKDVIKLTTGSIVELNRTIVEPVEVIVNNCVIARGEVVVVEGNFGVRIQQVVSREERLRTLF
jgi:flagellar motor switch protein FliN